MQADLSPIEFSAIRKLLSKLTSTPYGRVAAEELSPAPSLQDAKQMQISVDAARFLIDGAKTPRFNEVPDIRAAVRQVSQRGSSLSANALMHMLQVMKVCEYLADIVKSTPALYPGEWQEVQPPAEVLALIDKTILPNGSMREDASDELSRLFETRQQVRDEVEEAVKKRMKKGDIDEGLIEPIKPRWYMERAAIQIAESCCDKVKGVRRSSSMGGREVLIEPIEAVPLNNRLEAVVGKLTAEQQRILRAVTADIGEYHDQMVTMLDALTWIDLALAGGHLSANMNAHSPTLVDEPIVKLSSAYHPLLVIQYMGDRQGKVVPVPLSIELDDANCQMLVVTGPNTGGKTVALKTLGLLTAMAHCGLHIPAEQQCVIGNFSTMMVDVGDHQSLYHQLSTFAGHVEVLKRILASADENTLVLLDELGTGTDPEEGAALAMAVLDELLSRNVKGIVNTHLSPLKDYAANTDKVSNACMLFDDTTMKPTYELKIGQAGISLGLTIAQNNGLSENLVDSARAHLASITENQ